MLIGIMRLGYLVPNGVENRVGTIGSASATPGEANLRPRIDFVVTRPPRRRHGFARGRHALTPTAFGLMTAPPPRRRRPSSESQREHELGDNHGCFDTAQAALAELRHDAQRDRLFSLGDRTDYGPRSADAIHGHRARHEDMMRDFLVPA